MSPTAIDPGTLGPNALGQGIRVTWANGPNGRVAIVQGVLASITHDEDGTDLVIDIGISEITVISADLADGTVERV